LLFELKKYKKAVQILLENDFEVGQHASYFAFKSEKQFKKEKDKLETVFGVEILGNRHHYWHTNPEDPSETALIHENIGLLYDSSISFEKHSGFRYSICTPFHLWSRNESKMLSVLQIPPTLMDDHLFGYQKYNSFSNYEEQIASLVHSVLKNQGVFVADFHTRVLNSTFSPNWGVAYEYLLKTIESPLSYQ